MTPVAHQPEAKATHTAAPWGYWPSYTGEENTFEVGPGPYATIAHVRIGSDDVSGDCEANARLIAAAPELLDHVREQHNVIDILLAMLIERDRTFLPSQQPFWPTIAKTSAIIAKATGAHTP